MLAPMGRDAALIVEALGSAGFCAAAVGAAGDLVGAVAEDVLRDGTPQLGVLIATDDALGVDWSARLAGVLDRQAAWSDLPLILLAGGPKPGDGGAGAALTSAVAERLTRRGSVTVLDRPVRMAALVSGVRAALRARARQLEVCELIDARARALAEAERANRAKSELLAMVSHELRTPLNAIAGYVQLMEMGIRGPVTTAQRQALSRISSAQQHVLGILNTLLDYSRFESGGMEYRIEPVPVSESLSEVTGIVEAEMATRGLAYQTRMPPSPLLVAADREKLRQVLLNLVSNAMKFTPAGGRILVEANDADGVAAGDSVEVHVTDNGMGIPPDKLDAIFDPFVQAHAQRWTEGQRGTGLGLSISRQMVRSMGGDITVQSALEEGSRFTVRLPRADRR